MWDCMVIIIIIHTDAVAVVQLSKHYYILACITRKCYVQTKIKKFIILVKKKTLYINTQNHATTEKFQIIYYNDAMNKCLY